MLALTFGDNVGDAELVVDDRPDDGLNPSLLILDGVGNEGDLRSPHREFSLVALIQQRSGPDRCARSNMLSIVLECRDEAAVRSELYVAVHQPEPVLPSVLRWYALDPGSWVVIESCGDEGSGR
jgi:hypothetical protein